MESCNNENILNLKSTIKALKWKPSFLFFIHRKSDISFVHTGIWKWDNYFFLLLFRAFKLFDAWSPKDLQEKLQNCEEKWRERSNHMLFKCWYASFMSMRMNFCVFLEIIDIYNERIWLFWNILPFLNSSTYNLSWLIVHGFHNFSKKKNNKDRYLHTSKIFSSKNLCFYFITSFFSPFIFSYKINVVHWINCRARQSSLKLRSAIFHQLISKIITADIFSKSFCSAISHIDHSQK